MNRPLVSVVTVVYNDAAHIEATLLSVLNQTYPDIEYLVIDGGSSDGTVDVIRKYADRLAYWVSERDGGIYPAMNKGLAQVHGQWVSFMNSGDTFADERVIGDIFAHPEALEAKRVIGGHTRRVYADHSEAWEALPAEVIPAFIPYCHQSTFVRVDAEYAWRFDERYRIAADYKVLYDHYFRFGSEAFLNVDRYVANFSMEESTTFRNERRVKREYLSIQSKHPSWFWCKEYIKYLIRR